MKKAKPYRKEMDFAFFAVNFGYSKTDYEALTQREKAFIYKAWENRLISEINLMYNSMFTALYNISKPKNKRALKLWRKSRTLKADETAISHNYDVAVEADKNDGNEWIRTIYASNGLKLPERRGNG